MHNETTMKKEYSKKNNRLVALVALLAMCSAFCSVPCNAQDVIVNPDISYAGTPRSCEIGGIAVEGVEGI